jgi:hypothetical protein
MRADSCKESSPRCPRAAAGGLALAALITLAFAGVAAAAPAEAEDARCVSDCDCPAGELCRPPAGTCEPAVCPRIFRPVCGLDGKTYGNECEANAAHVVVAYEGECGAVCGGITGKRCPEGQVCDLPAGMCRGADLQGVCKQRPNVCPLIFDPVCGCDGKTYSNDCDRLAAAVQKDHDGPCEMAATEKSCQRNADCARDQYCAKPPGACGEAGSCQPIPGACPEIFDPVCGCDGVTYSNSCFAAMAGQSVRCEEECRRCLGGY